MRTKNRRPREGRWGEGENPATGNERLLHRLHQGPPPASPQSLTEGRRRRKRRGRVLALKAVQADKEPGLSPTPPGRGSPLNKAPTASQHSARVPRRPPHTAAHTLDTHVAGTTYNLTPEEPSSRLAGRAVGVVAAGTPLKTPGDRALAAPRPAAARGPQQRGPRSPPEVGGRPGWRCHSAAPSLTPAAGAAVCAHRTARQQQAVLGAQRHPGSPQLRSRPLPSALGPPGLAPTLASAAPQAQLRDPRALGPPQNSHSIPPRAQGPLWKAQVDWTAALSHSPFPPPVEMV